MDVFKVYHSMPSYQVKDYHVGKLTSSLYAEMAPARTADVAMLLSSVLFEKANSETKAK